MKRFLDLADFERDEISALLQLSHRLETSPEPRALAGKILGLLFFNPSLRTLASMQAGMARLGGTSFVITPGQGTWQLETKLGAVMNGAAAEHVREGIPVLASYCDVLGIRAFADGKDMAFDLADPARAGAYQGLSQTGYAVAQMLSPAVVTTSAIDHGTPGWIALGTLFAATGAATAVLANHAATRRNQPQPISGVSVSQ